MSLFRYFLPLMLIGWNAAQAQPQTRLTQAQAIQRAADFCRRLGGPVGGPAAAEYPAPKLSASPPENHWQPRWKVVFPDQAEIEVVDATGVISWFQNLALSNRYQQEGRRPAGVPISEMEAIQRATAALQATGQVGELIFEMAYRHQGTVPPTASMHNWSVWWRREFKGIPYQHQDASVTLDAETGEVKIVSLNFRSAPPAEAVLSISREQALERARSVIANAGIQEAVLTDAQILVVQPNTFWQPGGDTRPLPGLPRTAWVVTFEAGTTHRDWRLYEVRIDTHNGALLGGSINMLGGGKLLSREALQKAIQTAQEVRIYAQGANGKWQETPLAVLSEASEAKLLHLLRKEGRFRSYGPAVAPDYRVVIVNAEKGTTEFTYVAFEGALGAAGQWCLVPKEFKAWMDRLKQQAARHE